jgi:glycosyltransferase involved in cell wall biosynthesis
MIYLSAEVVSGLGEDTFWTWFKREFPNSKFGIPQNINKEDVILQYSTLGRNKFPDNTVGLLWELHPEMKVKLNSDQWDGVITKIHACASTCKYRTTPSRLMVPYYESFGKLDLLPIGVDTDLFRPMFNRNELKRKYGIPTDKRIGFWAGTTHPMKGFQNLINYKNENPDIYWIIVWKQRGESSNLLGHSNFTQISQQQLSELLNCTDFFLSCGLLQPFYMIEWEAMSCDVPIVISSGLEKDFIPSDHPRNDIFRLGWDRKTTKELWKNYIKEIIDDKN